MINKEGLLKHDIVITKKEGNLQTVPIVPMDVNEYLLEIKSRIKRNIPTNLKNIVNHTQQEQKSIIATFQNLLIESFNEIPHDITWIEEQKIGNRKDSIDIYGKDNRNGYNIIIELDKPRADQVAKKMVSRIANYLYEPFIYVAICYPGTDKMNPNECIKYFEFGKMITNKINSNSMLIGCIIDNNLNITFY